MSSPPLVPARAPADVLGNVFIFAQAGLFGSFGIVGVIAATTPGMPGLTDVLVIVLALAVVTAIGQFVPLRRLHSNALVLIAVADIALVCALREVLQAHQSGLSIIVVIPVLWLSYSFGIPALAVAFVGAYFVALFPFLVSGDWPQTSAAWGEATVMPAVITVVAIAVHIAARRQRRQIAQGLDAASAALTVVETVDAAITFYDSEGVVLLTNDAARTAALSRHAPGSVVEVYAEDRVTPVPLSERVVELAARGELVTRRLYWIRANGEMRAFVATSQYVRRANGEVIGTVIASHDVTPLAEAVQVRDQFLATVSHELRTPLTSILGYLEVIEDSLDLASVGMAAEFAIVQRNSRRLERLIGDLLTTANDEAQLERRPYDLARLARKSLDAVRASVAASGITVSLSAPRVVTAEIDADHIGDALGKLLSNAVKFTPVGGSIAIGVRQVGGQAAITVTDTGQGISEVDLPHVFERFYRGSGAISSDATGAGLGLPTARAIVELHGGSIGITSTPGAGTTVELRLPVTAGLPSGAGATMEA